MKIYDIPRLYREALESMHVDEETGEIMNADVITVFEMDAREKIESTALYVREQEQEAKVLGEEIARLQARRKSMENRSAWLKKLMLDALQPFEGKVKTSRITVYEKHTPVVMVAEGANLPPAYITTKTTITPNKIALKDALKRGDKIEGAWLQDSVSVVMR